MPKRRWGATLLIAPTAVAALTLFSATLRARVTRLSDSETARSRACALAPQFVQRIERGRLEGRSEDVIMVPRYPNYLGSFEVVSHSGPWTYLQEVPLVLYGPGRIPATVSEREITLADIYPTVGRLLGIDLPVRQGHSLDEALTDRSGVPRLVVVVVWDGAGRNVLERWPDAWPNLGLLEQRGTSYVNATVGSSPSITPSTHSTLGTGTWPSEHGVSGIQYRDGNQMSVSFVGRDPGVLALPTFADLVDREFDNQSKVGLVAWRGWHLGALGHGAALAGGDHDHLALIGFDGHLFGRREFYATPPYLQGQEPLARRVRELDARDGTVDGSWRSRDIASEHENPAWVDYETDVVLELVRTERYGQDRIPDLLFANYKITDIVGHRYSMDSPEMEEVLRAQDAALNRLVRYLDRNVRDYALIVTADHGHTPRAEVTGAWPIDQAELEADLNRHFEVRPGRQLTEAVTAVGLFLDHDVMGELNIEASDVAQFLDGYTIGDNAGDRSSDTYETRRDERIFSAVFPGDEIGEVAECAGLH